MTPRTVRFVTPERPYLGNTPSMFSIYGSNVDSNSPAVLHLPLDADPIAWWGAYVPLESWTPPKLRKSKFKGVVGLADYPCFQKYNLENEFPPAMKKRMIPLQKDVKHTSYASTATLTKSQACCPVSLRFTSIFHFFSNKWSKDMYLLESMRTSDITGSIADITGSNDQDPHDCGWDNPSLQGSAEAYASEWRHPGHDVGIAGSSELVADAYNCGWDDVMHDKSIMLVGESRDDMYDCGWDDPMGHELIMESSASPADAYNCGWDDPTDDRDIMSVGESVEDQYDCRWGDPMDTDKLFPAVMEEQHHEDVDPSMAEDPYDCGWDGREVEPTVTAGDDMVDLVSSGMPIGMPSTHAGNENNVFQHAEHSMQHAIRHLRSIWHQDVNSYLNNILPTTEGGHDPMPALTHMANRDGLGKYSDTVIKATELSKDIATIHHFLNVHRRIMEQLDDMITTCERGGRAT
ncbi:uncharacterized protein F5147DRAFT_782211 [Suillus discolor]|uniref:Uncharacterized protein n=1 Tax=Suillus discolor TaxID=1912936 RepID=A0A9P7JL67_9AGAM|nr:uncharacterized protein F5147DRAFT_782211 [Suillus discolor]KAG2085103.1 hypothetical protein F5147DRAFT_782211 [Suillus discolor]